MQRQLPDQRAHVLARVLTGRADDRGTPVGVFPSRRGRWPCHRRIRCSSTRSRSATCARPLPRSPTLRIVRSRWPVSGRSPQALIEVLAAKLDRNTHSSASMSMHRRRDSEVVHRDSTAPRRQRMAQAGCGPRGARRGRRWPSTSAMARRSSRSDRGPTPGSKRSSSSERSKTSMGVRTPLISRPRILRPAGRRMNESGCSSGGRRARDMRRGSFASISASSHAGSGRV